MMGGALEIGGSNGSPAETKNWSSFHISGLIQGQYHLLGWAD